MAIKVRWKFSYSVFICVFSACSLKLVDSNYLNDGSPSDDFVKHGMTKARLYHGRTKREISNSVDLDQKGGHVTDLIVSIDLNGIETILELTINHHLIGDAYFQKTQKNGSYHVHRPTIDEMELCHYQGHVRGSAGSWAALSTCRGLLRGIVHDGNETFFLDRGPEAGTSYVYEGKHLNPEKRQSCGFQRSSGALTRSKRETDAIRGPYNANRQSRYVELLLVVDNEEYETLGDVNVVYQYCKDITNIINALFVPLNIFIALIGVVVWTEKNEISLSTNGDTTLTNFLRYRREFLVKEHPNDNAQLLTRVQFEGGVVGKALKGPICTFQYSGGIFMDHSSVVGLVATTVAHELGHNFGMEHDRPDCECPDDRCIMAPSSSLEFLAQAFERGMDYCLRNKPGKLFDSPVCGNGFVEPGEQCDCGLPDRCNNPCCNATTCTMHLEASCATGECCDFETCKPKNAGVECRPAERECDLPEYCTGDGEYCPADVFKLNGDTCNGGKAYCYQGNCRSHSDQCQLLWGPTGKNSDARCYEKNVNGNTHGNCGFNRLNHTYSKCHSENIYCGMIQCIHFNERLEFGEESAATLGHTFINSGGNITACRTAMVDLGLNEVDPGLAPDGAKCGEGKMCVNQRCTFVDEVKKLTSDLCPNNCSGNGVCNSKGHCHCDAGFAPPLCYHYGAGGSIDSGPASDYTLGRKVTIALYVIFLVIILLSVLAFLFIYYTRHNVKIWWKKSPTRHASKPWDCKSRGSTGRGTSVLLPESVGIVDVGIIRDRSPGSKANLLNEKRAAVVVPPRSNIGDLQSELFVKGKGFTITPLKTKPNEEFRNSELDHEKSSAVLTPSHVKCEKVGSKACEVTSNGWENKDGRHRENSSVVLPGARFASLRTKPKNNSASVKDSSGVMETSSRPKISDPVLEGTTAKDLLADGKMLVPTRKAPGVPPANLDEESTPTIAGSRPDAAKARPASSPVELGDEKKLLKELKDGKEYPALTKIASLMKSASVHRSPSIGEKSKGKVKPEVKKLKFDREKLRNIEISNPIPQVEAAGSCEREPTVTRAQSMREPSQGKPGLQTFGSMRVASVAKRPISVHVHSRPTCPPPRPPPPPRKQDYSYDDCMNLLPGKNDENDSQTGNIYAVIDGESPKTQRKIDAGERKVRFEDDEEKPESAGFVEKKKSSSGSTESVGLLNEIVTEIEARNFDSIYSRGTLKKKKDMGESRDSRPNSKAIAEASSSGDPNAKTRTADSDRPSDISDDPSKKRNGKETSEVSGDDSRACETSSGSGSAPLAGCGGRETRGNPNGEKDAKSEFLTSRPTEPEPSAVPSNTPSSASPFVKSSFSRPSLLGAPTLPKLTPLSITSNFPKNRSDGDSARIGSKTVSKATAAGSGSGSSAATSKPAAAPKPASTGQKPAVPRKSTASVRDSNLPTRPLPSLPRAEAAKQTSGAATARTAPLSSSSHKTDGENSANKVTGGGGKPPKPETGYPTQKKTGNRIATGSGKPEGNGNGFAEELMKTVQRKRSGH